MSKIKGIIKNEENMKNRGPFFEEDEDGFHVLTDECLECDELYFEDIWYEPDCKLKYCKKYEEMEVK